MEQSCNDYSVWSWNVMTSNVMNINATMKLSEWNVILTKGEVLHCIHVGYHIPTVFLGVCFISDNKLLEYLASD